MQNSGANGEEKTCVSTVRTEIKNKTLKSSFEKHEIQQTYEAINLNGTYWFIRLEDCCHVHDLFSFRARLDSMEGMYFLVLLFVWLRTDNYLRDFV